MEEGAQSRAVKWEGKAINHLRAASADKVWSLLEDFVSAQKWILNVETCYLVEGERNRVGCVRYCAGSLDPSVTAWAKEKLTAIDPGQRTLTYAIVDNNAGFGDYAATLKVLSDVEEGCAIEWSFVCDPVGAFSEDHFKSYFDLLAKTMAQRMEAELQATD
ncbi:hypothetical protein H6P81_009102 [Aristolochia fimbriata]|uniref:Lachrymatory factor synthase n=1 Tax=Aristolochia fimbriata TaxID=158543 RepID=A0AAV7EJW4_ARIFI|nr:hypothetical protein H6P81_009102 [Aristolochia fimbriata]